MLRRSQRAHTDVHEWLPVLVAALFGYAVAVPVLESWHVPSGVSLLVGLALSSALVVPFGLLLQARRSPEYGTARGHRPAYLASACTLSVLAAQQLVDAGGSPGWPGWSQWLWFAAAGIVWTGTYNYASGCRRALLERILEVDDPQKAAELVDLCERELATEELGAERRRIVSLTLSGALVTLSSSPGNEDALARALTILDAESAACDSPAAAFLVAAQMVTALRAKRLRTGDDVGYERALDLMAEAARSAAADVPAAPGLAEAAWAQRWADAAEASPGGDEAQSSVRAALERLDRAVEATPERLPEHALHVAVRARLCGLHPLHGDLDRSIVECRGAVRRLRGHGGHYRATAQLALIDLLELRAAVAPDAGFGGALERTLPALRQVRPFRALWPERGENDLARAIVLCFGVMRSDSSVLCAQAGERLPRLRDELMARKGMFTTGRTIDRQTGWMYSQVARSQLEVARGGAVEVCERWAAWADARGDAAQAAEAGWCWATAVGSDLRRRVLEGKVRRISQVQGMFVEAADRLATVGRTREAALVLEFGRAILLTEHMDRERGGLDARLAQAGELELARRWRGAVATIDRYDRAAPGGNPGVGLSGLASAEYAARAEHDMLLREIAHVPGFEDVDGASDYDELRLSARDGPIVYLAATDVRGFALVVERGTSEPVAIVLPELHRARVDEHRHCLAAARDPVDVAAAMTRLLPRLWSEVLEPLLEHIAPAALVTLVPIGCFADLPLHMAGVEEDASGVWHDRTGGIVFRYSPNARVLLRAQRTADAVSRDDLRLLTAAVPEAPGWVPLTHAAVESRGVASQFADDRAVRADPATVANVVPFLDDATVWHFVCHGTHDPQAPLESTLELADRPLTARELLSGRRGRRRLAVLSACQTAKTGDVLPDEVIGFSSALLQAGVAGVVSCQAEVDDAASTLLMLDFFGRFVDEPAPASALAQSQAWLRNATNEEIHWAFPDVHPWPDDTSEIGRWRTYRPFADPSTWVVFSYTGA